MGTRIEGEQDDDSGARIDGGLGSGPVNGILGKLMKNLVKKLRTFMLGLEKL